MPRSGTPHIVVSMFSEMAEGDAHFHGEIKVAIRIMYRRLKTASLRRHVVAPVSLPHSGQEEEVLISDLGSIILCNW